MAPHSSTLAWEVPWTEEPGRLQSMGSRRVERDWATSLSRIGEGNGNPLQCSCLENPRDWGAWWAAVYGVAQSRTRLKRRSSSSSFIIIICFLFIVLVAQLCLTLCNPLDCNLPDFSVLGIFQARILDLVAISFSRGSSWPRDQTQSSALKADSLPTELPGKPTYFLFT